MCLLSHYDTLTSIHFRFLPRARPSLALSCLAFWSSSELVLRCWRLVREGWDRLPPRRLAEDLRGARVERPAARLPRYTCHGYSTEHRGRSPADGGRGRPPSLREVGSPDASSSTFFSSFGGGPIPRPDPCSSKTNSARSWCERDSAPGPPVRCQYLAPVSSSRTAPSASPCPPASLRSRPSVTRGEL